MKMTEAEMLAKIERQRILLDRALRIEMFRMCPTLTGTKYTAMQEQYEKDRQGFWGHIWNEISPDASRRRIGESVSQLGLILSHVNNLAFQVEEDEFGLVRPSYHAHRQCLKILLELAAQGEFFKPSDISTDRNGDIRISWVGDGREAELVCPSADAELPYIYYSCGETYGTEPNATAGTLLSRIVWATESDAGSSETSQIAQNTHPEHRE